MTQINWNAKKIVAESSETGETFVYDARSDRWQEVDDFVHGGGSMRWDEEYMGTRLNQRHMTVAQIDQEFG